MKKILITLGLVLLHSALSFGAAATVARPALVHLSDNGMAIPIMREALDSGTAGGPKPYLIVLDTTEVDTGYINVDILPGSIYSVTDTIGVVSYTCKDSTGTDTLAIVMKWQGNPRPDGKGVWANVDSTELKDLGASGAAGNGVYTNKTAVVVNSGGYSLFRFFLKNKLAANANRKSTCKDALLIRRHRAAFR
jgi:hypothetical protein